MKKLRHCVTIPTNHLMQFARRFPVILIVLAGSTFPAQPQQCPTETKDVPASVNGTLDYHPGVYAWYGLHPAQPVCGQKVLQVGLDSPAEFREAHRFVGCEVTVSGNLLLPATGYWSVPLGVVDARIRADKTCKQGQPLPDYSAIPIPSTLKRYKIIASYDPKTEIFSAQAYDISSGKSLSPWQAYASDSGNGGRDLQRMFCAEGFVASDPRDTNGKTSLQANADPDFPQAIEVELPNDSIVQVSFVCTRSARTKKE